MRGPETRWKPDGWDATLRLGVLVPHAAVGPESELQAMAPPGVTIHATRVPFGAMSAGGLMDPTIPLGPVRAFAEPPHVDDAAELLATSPLDVIAFANTGAAYAIGLDGEIAMIARLESRTRGIPVVSTGRAVVDGLRALAVRRIACFDPPWFDTELSELGRRYYESAGFEVDYAAPSGLQSDQASITPADLHAWVLEHAPREAEAVVIGGNGLRSVGVIAALEEDLGRPVLTANQALFWAAFRVAGVDSGTVVAYGQLFRHRQTTGGS
jgi:maleate isomerase